MLNQPLSQSSTPSKWLRRGALTLSGFVLAGCASQIPVLTKTEPVPDTIPEVVRPEGFVPKRMSDVKDNQWWLVAGVPELTRVIEIALARNTDVRLAQERLNETGALLGIAKTAQWPALFAQASSTRSRPTQAGNVPVFGGQNVYKTTQAALGLSWELDLWGRLSDLEDAATAQFMAQTYNYQGVRLSVSAAAATLYTRVRVFRLLVEIGEQTLISRKAALDLQTQRFEAGLTNELQYRQVQAEFLAVEAQMPDLREQLVVAETALQVLTGQENLDIPRLTVDQLTPTPLVLLPEAVPSELLLRRPDLAAAEQQLVAAQANLSAARKAFFPSIELNAAIGSESAQFDNLFKSSSRIWNASLSATQPVFQAGRLFDEQDAQVARQNQAVITYEAAIRRAFGEVTDALAAQEEAVNRLESRTKQVQSLMRLVELAQKRVDAGISTQLELLDAQRTLLATQLEWALAWGGQQSALLAVIRALGGGFEATPTEVSQAQ